MFSRVIWYGYSRTCHTICSIYAYQCTREVSLLTGPTVLVTKYDTRLPRWPGSFDILPGSTGGVCVKFLQRQSGLSSEFPISCCIFVKPLESLLLEPTVHAAEFAEFAVRKVTISLFVATTYSWQVYRISPSKPIS